MIFPYYMKLLKCLEVLETNLLQFHLRYCRETYCEEILQCSTALLYAK